MKKVLVFIFLGLVLFGCGEQEPKDKYVIDGEAPNVFNGIRVYLSKINERGAPVPTDTAIVMNETFKFEGKVDYPQLYFLTINGTPGRLPIVLENGKSILKIDNKILTNSEYLGSDNHDMYEVYNEEMKKLGETVNLAKKALSDATFVRDSIKMKTNREAYDKSIEKISNYPYTFIEDNNDSYVVLPILSAQLNSRGVDFERISNLYENLEDELKATAEGEKIKTTLDRMKAVYEAEKATAIGATAPTFSAPNPDGEIVKLDDVISKGKVTIIDFWAAWCGPCRKENPNVVKVYNKYHDKGLEIIGVGLDGRRGQQNPKEAWKKAIETDNLTWHQVSNLKYFDEIAESYNVRSIPSMFVLDSDGKIIAKNLRGSALERKIGELLN